MSSTRTAAIAIASLVTLAACGGSRSSAPLALSTPVPPAPPPPAPTGSNALSITVDGTLCSTPYQNEPCVEVTVCTPDQVDCQVVSNVLLDTGSYGLRIFRQALTVNLPTVAAGGGTVATCAHFGDGSTDWGPVASAAVVLGQEPAVKVPVQIIDAGFATPPASCAAPASAPSWFNGILGVGPFVSDCGNGCSSSAANGVYFTCGPSGCLGYAAPRSGQIQNPAALVGADGGGLLVHLPSVPAGGAASANGELRLGVGTRSNNQPSGVTVLPLDGFGELRLTTMGQAFTAFADTGSNGLFFTPPSSVTTLPTCPSPLQAWYCPASTLQFAATASGASGAATVPFTFDVGNFQALIAGSAAVSASDAGTGLPGGLFDLGLPFFLGRDVWIGFEGMTSSLGTGPLVAF